MLSLPLLEGNGHQDHSDDTFDFVPSSPSSILSPAVSERQALISAGPTAYPLFAHASIRDQWSLCAGRVNGTAGLVAPPSRRSPAITLSQRGCSSVTPSRQQSISSGLCLVHVSDGGTGADRKRSLKKLTFTETENTGENQRGKSERKRGQNPKQSINTSPGEQEMPHNRPQD